jgi:hypothetical protein
VARPVRCLCPLSLADNGPSSRLITARGGERGPRVGRRSQPWQQWITHSHTLPRNTLYRSQVMGTKTKGRAMGGISIGSSSHPGPPRPVLPLCIGLHSMQAICLLISVRLSLPAGKLAFSLSFSCYCLVLFLLLHIYRLPFPLLSRRKQHPLQPLRCNSLPFRAVLISLILSNLSSSRRLSYLAEATCLSRPLGQLSNPVSRLLDTGPRAPEP